MGSPFLPLQRSIAVAAACSVPALAMGQEFIVLENVTWLDAVSGDGRYVAGVETGFPQLAFRFDTVTGVREPIGEGRPADMTPDGTAIVGNVDPTAFLWTEDEGYMNLGASVPAFGRAFARAISDDGMLITGDPSINNGFVYSRSGTVVELEDCATPYDISGDGSVIAGGAKFTGERFLFAAVWDSTGQITDFREEAEATVMSADGRFAGGYDGATGQFFRYSTDRGFELLDTLPGALQTTILGISGDGSVLAGYVIDPTGVVAMVWTLEDGARSLKSFLEDEHGFDLAGWNLTILMSISDDGKTFAGRAIDPSGTMVHYVARLGGPCVADIDGDGELTLFDFIAFQNLFGTGDLAADFDGDGELTIFDFLEFQSQFATGC